MKFEESSLFGYLVEHLKLLTEADPVVLSKYVVALLKKDKTQAELKVLCADNLVEFLGNGAKSFTADLFQALENGLIPNVGSKLDAMKKSEPSQSPIAEATQLKSLSSKGSSLSSFSVPTSDSEDEQVSDDGDADRNHKHRRRGDLENSSEEFIDRFNRKRKKPTDDGQLFLGSDSTSCRGIPTKFRKHQSDSPLSQPPLGIGPPTRFNQPLHIDLSAPLGHSPVNKGRGRSIPWIHCDSKFNHDTLDSASQMEQGPVHRTRASMETGLLSSPCCQSSSWGGRGLIPGSIVDPLNPLGLQVPLQSTIGSLNLGISRQHCQDFEEQGFCLRGDMCPMEHGLNRIIVEDVQSLSRFNLPVSVPSSHGSGPLPPFSPASGHLANNKSLSNRSSQSLVLEDALEENGVPFTFGGVDQDVYDPDQPLWENGPPHTSAALSRLSSPNFYYERTWIGDFRSADSEIKNARRGMTSAQSTKAIVWGRIGCRNKSGLGSRVCDDNVTDSFGNEIKEDHEEVIQRFPRSTKDARNRIGRRALRTLFVNKIPHESNRRDALISHFQKFGEVVDIYIPRNSERAFVMFSTREEADAALKSPDAVMGNRFIRLSRAYHDRITDEGFSNGHNYKSVQSPSIVLTSVPSKQPVVNGGKEILTTAQLRDNMLAAETLIAVANAGKGSSASSAQKKDNKPAGKIPAPVAYGGKETLAISGQIRSNKLAFETPVPASGPVRGLICDAAKAAPSLLKYKEKLALLEELRKKQVSLAKKRDDFKRQLVKLEKQAISTKKKHVIPEHEVRRHEGCQHEKAAATPRNSARNAINTHQVAEKTLEKLNSDEVLISDGLKENLIIMPNTLMDINRTSSPASVANKFKLSNRSTSFRILPPLPADFANVTVLRDHFSQFGVISSAMLDDQEVKTGNEGLQLSETSSACITFATHHSAGKAYQTGKCWEDHNLQFKWVSGAANSCFDRGVQEFPSSSPMVAEVHVQPNSVTSGSSLDDGTNCSPISLPISAVEKSQCSATMG